MGQLDGVSLDAQQNPRLFETIISILYGAYASNVIHLFAMKTLTVRLPEAVVAEIEAESRRRKLSKSDVVRERLRAPERSHRRSPALLDAIADLIGSVDGLPRNLSAQTKKYLKSTGYGDKRAR
jgi:Arc/MetJ-type ribon-helix-helix transcriptional regulator